MASSIRVNGKTFDLFKQLDLSRSKDDFSSEARIIVSQPVNNNPAIKSNDLVEIFLDEIKVMTGYIDKLNDSESNSDHDLSYTLRDKVQDLIDSSVPDNVKSLDNVTSLAQLCQLCIDGLGLTNEIKVIDKVGVTFDDEIKAASVGQNCGEFLQEYARKGQVFLNTDGFGNVLIQREFGKLITVIQNIPNAINNNVKSSSISVDNSKRFNKYRVRSNSTLSNDKTNSDNMSVFGDATDDEIRSSRYFEKLSEASMTEAECRKSAEDEANIRRSRSLSYSCEIVGFSANGELWEPGKLVSIRDEKKDLFGTFLINSISYSDSGSELIKLEITYPDKFKVQANPSTLEQRTTNPGRSYTVREGEFLAQIAFENNISTENLIAANPQIANPDLIYPDQKIKIPSTGGIA